MEEPIERRRHRRTTHEPRALTGRVGRLSKYRGMLENPVSRFFIQYRLIAEIDARFTGELLINDERIHADTKLSDEQWTALVTLYHALTPHCPEKWDPPPHLPAERQPDPVPVSMWRHGVEGVSRILRWILTPLCFIYSMSTVLQRAIRISNTWEGRLDYLDRCYQAIEDTVPEADDAVPRPRQTTASDKLYSHLQRMATALVPKSFQQSHYREFCSLVCGVTWNGLIAWACIEMCPKEYDDTLATGSHRRLILLRPTGLAAIFHIAKTLYAVYACLRFASLIIWDKTYLIISRLTTPTQRSARFRSRGTRFNVDGKINGLRVEANADTGASFNVISSTLASQLKLPPEPGTGGWILLPSGKRIYSSGRVEACFKFGDEIGTHDISCIILEAASHDLVLGSKFLRLTQTFTKHRYRLKKVFSLAPRFSLNLLGDAQEAIPGFLNGIRCNAVPDSGSDIMALSGRYAKAHGLRVHRNRRQRNVVEFIDGSRQRTDGIVKGISWQFRPKEGPIRCDFHVIDNLPVDAILSNAMIDEHNVFTRYGDLLSQIKPVEDQSGIYNIRLVKKCREELARLGDSFVEDMKSDSPFTPAIMDREVARRDMIRDRINGLPEPERSEQRAKEAMRKARFDEELRKHLAQMARAGQQSQPRSTASSQASGTGNGQPATGPQQSMPPLTQPGSRRSRILAWIRRD